MAESCDIAVIGAGPAGANAAMTAAANGASVVVLDEQPRPGGQVWRARSAAIRQAPETPETRAGDALRAAARASEARFLGDARVWQIERQRGGWDIHSVIGGGNRVIHAQALILATGAQENVQPVPGWTTPGVIGLAGTTALLKQELTLPGRNTVVAGTGPLVFFVASELRRLGGTVAAVVMGNSRRAWLRALPAMMARTDLMRRGAVWGADLMLAGVPILWRHAVCGVKGDAAVSSVTLTRVAADGAPVGDRRQISADSLCLGNGLIPSTEAARLAGIAMRYRPRLGGWVPDVRRDGGTDRPGVFICGDGAGIRGAAAAEIQGILSGHAACAYVGRSAGGPDPAMQRAYARATRFGEAMTALSLPGPGAQALTTGDTILCRCEGLTRQAIAREITAGAESISAIKSGQRAGMGPCGGKYCQAAIARLVADLTGQAVADVALPTPRPPLRPVPAAALAGEFEYDDLPIPKPAPL